MVKKAYSVETKLACIEMKKAGKSNNTLRKSNSNHVSVALPYSSTACG